MLQPGMEANQVRFVLGSPVLIDVFHPDRWDYVYSDTQGKGEPEEYRLTIFFENDRLARVEGDFQPRPLSNELVPNAETLISVPPRSGGGVGIINKALRQIGIDSGDDYDDE